MTKEEYSEKYYELIRQIRKQQSLHCKRNARYRAVLLARLVASYYDIPLGDAERKLASLFEELHIVPIVEQKEPF